MQGRPLSSRPSTSARPATAFDRDQFQHHQQRLQQQQPHEIEEDYEESDDEDVFAFLPPSTADQERQSTSFAFANHVQYPEPTFDPWGRQYPICPTISAAAATSSIGPDTYTSPSPSHAAADGIPSPIHSHLYNQPPLPPSPSTDSHPSTGMSGPDLYRLKKLGTATSSKLGVVDDIKEMDREPKVDSENEAENLSDSAGPSHSHSQSNSQSQSQTYHQSPQQQRYAGNSEMPQAPSSLADSLSITTQRMLEDDESRSIK
jgi:hypothetical protein